MSVVAFADETVSQDEVTIVEDSIEYSETEDVSSEAGETIITEIVTEYVDVDTDIELENNELFYRMYVCLQYIMYILFVQFFMLWTYIIYIVVRKLCKFFGFGVI